MKNIHILIPIAAVLASTFVTVEPGLCAGRDLAGSKTSSSSAGAKLVYVEVKVTKLKAKPEYLGANLADLSYGAALSLVSESSDQAGNKDGWIKVKSSSGVVGYVHSSALSARRVVLSGSSDKKLLRADESPTDIVMAGKGFSKEVEKEFAAKNPALNFAAVNAMEKIKIGEGETRVFARAGGLLKGGQS